MAFVVLAGCVAAAWIGVVLGRGGPVATRATPTIDIASQTTVASDRSSVAIPGRAAPIPRQRAPGGTVEDMRHAFLAATDLRAFASWALERPREGGVFHAIRAVDECRRIRNESKDFEADVRREIAQTGTVTARRRATVDRLVQRCASFTDDEFEHFGGGVDVIRERGKDDPLVRPILDFVEAWKSGDVDGRRRAFAAMLAAGDGMLLGDRTLYAKLVSPAGDRRVVLWFEGRELEGAAQRDFERALPLAACAVAPSCERTFAIERRCAREGFCPDGPIDDFLRDPATTHLGEDSKGRALALMPRIRDALIRGDVDAFMPPRDANP